jgi:hypothetical protein
MALAGHREPMVFTVNLGKDNYFQFGLIFEGATPEAPASCLPAIQAEIAA